MSYQETIAELRQAAAQRELRDKVAEAESWLADVRQCERQALEYEQDGDRQNALISAESANQAQRELDRVLAEIPPQQQQLSPGKQAFLVTHRDFLEKHGAKAVEALGVVHGYATRPKNPGTNNPALTGMGLQEDSPEYFQAINDLLSMYGKAAGLRFEEGGSLTPDEAAQISGISGREWNAQAEKLISEGRHSDALYNRQWSRKV